MENSRPSVRLSFFLLWGMGLHGNSEVSDVCLVGAGPSGARPHLNKCFMERKRRCFRMDEVSGQLQLVSTAEKLCLDFSV